MTHDSDLQNPAPLYTDPTTVRLGAVALAQSAQVTEQVVPDGTAARLPVEVQDEYERRLCELEARLEALENKLDSAIMPISKQFWIDLRRDLINIGRTIATEFHLVSK